jgi:hypothetical protein
MKSIDGQTVKSHGYFHTHCFERRILGTSGSSFLKTIVDIRIGGGVQESKNTAHG